MRSLAARDSATWASSEAARNRPDLQALLDEGMPAECLERVHAPIGLEIGAVTPAEIAISIVAELVAIRHGKDVSAVSMQWTPSPRRATS